MLFYSSGSLPRLFMFPSSFAEYSLIEGSTASTYFIRVNTIRHRLVTEPKPPKQVLLPPLTLTAPYLNYAHVFPMFFFTTTGIPDIFNGKKIQNRRDEKIRELVFFPIDIPVLGLCAKICAYLPSIVFHFPFPLTYYYYIFFFYWARCVVNEHSSTNPGFPVGGVH